MNINIEDYDDDTIATMINFLDELGINYDNSENSKYDNWLSSKAVLGLINRKNHNSLKEGIFKDLPHILVNEGTPYRKFKIYPKVAIMLHVLNDIKNGD